MFSLQKISVSVCFVILSVNVFAGDLYRPAAGARQAGIAYTCVMRSDQWSSFHNQAGLALNKSISFGFNYENRFDIKELGTKSICVIIPAGKSSIGTVYSHFGYTDFTRQILGIACGLSVSEKIAVGVQLDYFSENIAEKYGNNQALTFELGALLSASENVKVGVHLFNPLPASIQSANMPSGLRVGAGVNLAKDLFAGIETEMVTGQKPDIRAGFEYEAAKKFWLRGGFSTANSSFSFGFGYSAKPALIDIGFSTHEKLGITSSISIIFIIKNY